MNMPKTTTHLKGLPTELRARIAELATDLSNFASDAREEFDAKSDDWRDSDEAGEVDAWIESLDDAAGMLEDLEETP